MPKTNGYISLMEATKHCDYSQEYLSLRARQGKLKAVKFGRNWVTKKEWLDEYLINNPNVKKLKLKQDSNPEFELPKIDLSEIRYFIRYSLPMFLIFCLLGTSIVFGKDIISLIPEMNLHPIKDFKDTVAFISDIEMPEIKMPEIKIEIPQIEMPEIEMQIPKIEIPQIIFPDFPEFKLPKIEKPKLVMPEISLPKIEMPEIKFPEIEQPKFRISLTEIVGGIIVNSKIRLQDYLADAIAQTSEDLEYGVNIFQRFTGWYKDQAIVVGKTIKETPFKISGGISKVGGSVKEKLGDIYDFIFPSSEIVLERESVNEALIVENGGVEEIPSDTGILKEETKIIVEEKEVIKEVQKITQIEPIKEVITEIKTIDDESLTDIKKQIISLQSSISAFPNTYVNSGFFNVGGTGTLTSLGVSTAGFKYLDVADNTTLGTQPNDDLTVNATSFFNAPIRLYDSLNIGEPDSEANFTVDTSGNLTTAGDFTITGDFTVSGAQTYSGAASFAVSSSSDGLLVNQQGTGNVASFQTDGVDNLVIVNGGQTTITSASSPQLKVAYDSSNYAALAIDSQGDLVLTATGGDISFGDENIATTGIISGATWQGAAIATQYGGTGQDWSATAQGNIPYFSAIGAMSTLAPGTVGYALLSGGAGADPYWGLAGVNDATYVTLSLNGSLSAERVLTGTLNQITISDGGANGNIVLSTPQDIAAASSPTFTGLTLSGLGTDGVVITSSGVLSSEAQLAVARGGTGAATAGDARTNLGLGNVENTALSTWAGTSNITTVGTLTSGAIGAGFTEIADSYIANDLTISSTKIASFSAADNSNPILTVTQTGTNKIVDLVGDSITTGTGLSLSTDGLTTGTGIDIASTSTAGGASGSSKLLNLARSGANASASHTAYGLYSSVVNTGTTSANVAAYLSASGATSNYGLLVAAGNVGIGVTDPDAPLEVYNAGTQLKLSYDGTDNATFAVDDNGDLTITPSGDEVFTSAGSFIGSSALTVKATSGDLTLTNDTSGNIAITSLGTITETVASGSTYTLTDGSTNFLAVDASGAIVLTPTSGQSLSATLATTGDFVVNTTHLVVDTSEGNVGIGLAAPGRNLDILDATASTPQIRLTNDADTYAELYVDATGDLSIGLTDGAGGDDIVILDENIKICTGGSFGSVSCPAFGIDGTGNLIIEDELYIGPDTSNYVQISGSTMAYAGTAKPKRSIVLTAAGGITPSVSGAAQTKIDGTNHTYYVLDFDAASDEAVYWQWTMPDSYDDGTIDITYYWEAASTSDDVVWCFQAKGLTANNAEDIDSALSAAVCETDTAQANANDLASATETGATSNFAKGEYVTFKVFRDADNGSDTMTGDARLVKVKIEYSVSAESD